LRGAGVAEWAIWEEKMERFMIWRGVACRVWR
jgi:hypothetical protein